MKKLKVHKCIIHDIRVLVIIRSTVFFNQALKLVEGS